MPERVLGPAYVRPSGALSTLGSRWLIGPGGSVRSRSRQASARSSEIVRLLQQAPKRARQSPSVRVTTGTGRQLAVREVGLVAAQVEVDAGGAGDRAADAVRVDRLGRQHADAAGPGPEDLVAEDQVRRCAGSRRPHLGDRVPGPAGPARPAGPP